MSVAKQIVEGMAFELWAQALAGYIHDHPHDTRRGDEYEDLIRGAGEPPTAAMQPAMELANMYELATGMTLVQILEHIRKNPWGDLDDEWLSDPFEVGHLLAGMAINHPENWPAASKLDPVHFEITFTGEKLVWSGDISPKTNPRTPHERFPCTACGGQGPHDGPGHPYTTQPTPGRGLHEHECTGCGGRGPHDGPGHAYTTHVEKNPARGPVRAGEASRFRTTERGFGRTTAIIPRRREMSDDEAAQRIVDRDPALRRRAEQITADRSRARQRPRRR